MIEPRLVEAEPLSPAENAALDIRPIQQNRAQISKGYSDVESACREASWATLT
jgi:hypothetical protein